MDPSMNTVESELRTLLPDLERVYTDIHAHPELSMQETRTAGIAADRLRAAGFDVTAGVGKTGVVGVLRNGEGRRSCCVRTWTRCPFARQTGLAYASTADGDRQHGQDRAGDARLRSRHACGLADRRRDALAQTRDTWKGTLMAVFQPAEETGAGAQAMIDDGLFNAFPKPDVVLGQHVMVGPAGMIGGRAGVITSAADSLQIRMFGRGAHGSMPQASIDPVVMAAATVLRLQTIVSRELAADRRRRRHDRLATGGHEGKRHSGRSDHQTERAHLRRRRADSCAGRDHADRERRSGRLRRAQSPGDHADRPILARHERSRCDATCFDAFDALSPQIA